MSQNTETRPEAEHCGRQDCFACHLKAAIAAFTAYNADKDNFTPEQEDQILHVIAGTAGILLSGEPMQKAQAFVNEVLKQKAADEFETHAQNATVALFKAMFGSYPPRPRG